ncbi:MULTISPECIES: pilus assembly protein PilP [unclassified Roseivivax]|uniref:pilus assembly protein PilP n=1 Tax=Roseivivax sp. GX 12232 TaxID=2900547 RepID=UPI001E4206A6|nr:pilus assembly protein PilP [Roseivivax sp. GX 12232]MCE0504513.1 pilus assembly protein PilP [Roseivivax sp. GX 12232]
MANAATPRNVADQATTHANIDMNGISLLGVMGTEAQPTALLRLPSGTVAKVAPGTRVGRRVVAAIDADRLALVEGDGRTTWIRIPGTNGG